MLVNLFPEQLSVGLTTAVCKSGDKGEHEQLSRHHGRICDRFVVWVHQQSGLRVEASKPKAKQVSPFCPQHRVRQDYFSNSKHYNFSASKGSLLLTWWSLLAPEPSVKH